MKTSHKILIAGGLILGVASAGAISHAALDDDHNHRDGHERGDFMSHGKKGKYFLKMLDVDGDGMVSKDEVQSHLKLRFDALDADGDGQIGLEEFSARQLDRFVMIDGDGDSFITKQELREMHHKRHHENDDNSSHQG